MHYIDLIKDLIKVLLKSLKKGLKRHKQFAILFPIIGIIIVILTFIFFDTFKEKVATVLFSIAGCFIGTICVFQVQEIVKDEKKIATFSALDKSIDSLKKKPSKDGVVEEKVFELFTETLKETLK